jgi:hypothetical protein
VYKHPVRLSRLRLALAATVVLSTAACGGGTKSEASPPPAKHNAAAYDTVDVCRLAADGQLRDVLGEAPATPVPSSTASTASDTADPNDKSIKGCVIDGETHRFYVFITVRRSPAGGPTQFSYDRASATEPAKVTGVGVDAFSYHDDGEAHVEALDGDLVIGVAFVYYTQGGAVSDAPELIQRLSGLAKQIVQRI